MTDAPFVAAAFMVVVVSLGAYAATLRRRIATAHRVVIAVEQERERRWPGVNAGSARRADEGEIRA